MSIYQIIRPLVFKLEPESAHNLAINFLKYLPRFSSLLTKNKEFSSLSNQVFGIDFVNPVGMAAGFDKNAEVFASLFNFGFGFVEVGTATPKPQMGNPKPRLFRLENDLAIINRFGFNNCGAEAFAKNFQNSRKMADKMGFFSRPLGINIGKNKDGNLFEDYEFMLREFYFSSHYITINISSPNTKNLRDIQNPEQLDNFLLRIGQVLNQIQFGADQKNRESFKQDLSQKKPAILLKLAPDLDLDMQQEIAKIVSKHHSVGTINGLIISNTTIKRELNLSSTNAQEAGGLSGKPLFSLSNEILKNFYRYTETKVPIIAAGGISCGQDAFEKICLGASLIQLYSALIYQGFGLVEKIKTELASILKQKGFKNVSQAIGSSL